MFTANIAFTETLSFTAPEENYDILREHSVKRSVFIVMSIESDNNRSHLLASPFCLTLAQTKVFVFDLPYFTSTPELKQFLKIALPGDLAVWGEMVLGRVKWFGSSFHETEKAD